MADNQGLQVPDVLSCPTFSRVCSMRICRYSCFGGRALTDPEADVASRGCSRWYDECLRPWVSWNVFSQTGGSSSTGHSLDPIPASGLSML